MSEPTNLWIKPHGVFGHGVEQHGCPGAPVTPAAGAGVVTAGAAAGAAAAAAGAGSSAKAQANWTMTKRRTHKNFMILSQTVFSF